jgi:hypothetical protein
VGGTWTLSAAPKTSTAKLREQLATQTTIVEAACEYVPLLLLLEVGDETFGSLLGFLHRLSGHP